MNSARKALLLNPPGEDVYIRDYYCSKSSRTDYTFPPIDLLHTGGHFRQRNWSVSAIDAIVQNLSIDAVLEQVKSINPDVIFLLVGAVSVVEDATFIKKLRGVVDENAVLVGSGDVLREHGEKWVENGLLDAATMDFSSPSPVLYGEGIREGLFDLIYRDDDGQVVVGGKEKGRKISVGLPPHDLFKSFPYRFPFARHLPFASVLTDYGCPFRCSFCVMAGLHYHRRPLDEIASEFQSLKSQGIREFIIWDQTFAVDRKRGMEILDLLPSGQEKFSWSCLIRPDRIDDELAEKMVAKGCHTAIMGVESSKEETLIDIKKDFTTKEVRSAMATCRKAGLELVTTVIVGLPGETEADVAATMEFICDIDPDYVSVHTAIPRSGTELRASMVEQGLINADMEEMDQSGEQMTISSDALSAEKILKLRQRFNRRFHLRPKYLLRMGFRRLRHPRLFFEQLRQGLTLLGRNA